MENARAHGHAAPADAAERPPYPPDVQGLMQTLLSMLADLDSEYELEMRKLQRGSAREEIKQRVRRKLAEQHRARREPYASLTCATSPGFRPPSATDP